jgi:hypothetical protein
LADVASLGNQLAKNRRVCCGERQIGQRRRSLPLERWFRFGRRIHGGAGQKTEPNMRMLVLMLDDSVRSSYPYRKPRLLLALACCGLVDCFAWFDFAAWELPKARQRHTFGAATHEIATIAFDDSNGDLDWS